MATTRSSVFYASRHTSGYLQKAYDFVGRVVPVPFQATLLSTAATGDIYNLIVIPANWRVVGLNCSTNGLGASAGTGTTIIIGDSGDTDRYLVSADADLINQPAGTLASTGMLYTPTADTIVYCTLGGTIVAGKVVSGCFFLVPGV